MSEHLTGGLGNDRLEPMGVGLDGLDVDIHRGAHDFPDITSQLPETDDIQQFGVRFEDAVKHMSVNKYESEASMIREYVANMAATCLEAEERLDEDYSPVIHIAYYPDSQTLIMEDNGMGMSEDEIDAVGTQLGVSTNRYNSDRGGKFGIGLLSGLKGVGLDGAFFMHSRSRRTDEYVRGLWSAYGFKRVEKLPDKLEPGQYGTRFEFPLKDPEVEIQPAIMEMARWSRVPVLYTERNDDGTLVQDDEFGDRESQPFTEAGNRPDGGVVIENESFRAIHAPSSSGETILLDVPIERNFEFHSLEISSDLPYRDFDLVFKTEDQEIIAGPHEGLTRVSDGEYAEMPEERREGYIPARECSPSDVWTPAPAGDRDRFEQNPDFWRWLAETVRNRFQKRLQSIVASAEAADQVLDIGQDNLDFILSWMDRETLGNDSWTGGKLSKHLERYGVEIDQETRHDLAKLSQTVERCTPGEDPWTSRSRTEVPIYEILFSSSDEGDIWMATHPSEKRAKIIWGDHEDNIVVRVGATDLERFEEQFGWRRLNYVEESTLDEFDISQESVENFKTETVYDNPNAGEDAPDRILTLHRAKPTDDNDRGYKDWTSKETARYLRAYLEARDVGKGPGESLRNPIDQLILFPSNSDEKLTDYLGVLGLGGVRLANCAVKVWDYLKDLDRVSRVETFIDRAKTFELPTSEGEMTIPEARDQADAVVLHLLHHSTFPQMQDQPEMSVASKWFTEEFDRRYNPVEDHDDVVYAPITAEMLSRLLPEIRKDDVYVAQFETRTRLPSEKTISYRRGTTLYAYANLHRWHDTPEFQIITNASENLADGMQGVIDGLAAQHDDGKPAPSEAATVDGETYETIIEVAR